MASQSVFAYWEIRGLAQPIRLLLQYAGEKYEDVRYHCGEAPDYDRSGWMKAKPTLGLDFPNLPYYIDGDLKLTQSNAILRHLARKHNLYGDNKKDMAKVDVLLEQVMDMRNGFVRLVYGNDYSDAAKAAYIKGAKDCIASFEKVLGSKKFFVGDKITVCDFHIYEMMEQHRLFEPKLLENAPKIQAYLKRFEELPAIQKYRSSDKFIERPINNKMAHFK